MTNLSQKQIDLALKHIEACDNVADLQKVAANAKRHAAKSVFNAAKIKLYALLPQQDPKTFEYDVWRSIYTLEDTLTEERGRTTRLSRTRQKIARESELKTVKDLVLGKPSDGYRMLIERDLKEYTFEALVLRHEALFDDDVIAAAKARLEELP